MCHQLRMKKSNTRSYINLSFMIKNFNITSFTDRICSCKGKIFGVDPLSIFQDYIGNWSVAWKHGCKVYQEVSNHRCFFLFCFGAWQEKYFENSLLNKVFKSPIKKIQEIFCQGISALFSHRSFWGQEDLTWIVCWSKRALYCLPFVV